MMRPTRTFIMLISLVTAACSSGTMGPTSNTSPMVGAAGGGATPGGVQDVGYFRAVLAEGGVPTADSINLEGLLSEHSIPSPTDAPCNQTVCLEAVVGHDRAVAEDGGATFIQLAMNSNVDLSQRRRLPLNLAVVVDVSGSMGSDNKLDDVKQGLDLLVNNLDAEDRFALVTYSSSAQVALPSQLVTDPASIRAAIDSLQAGGSTDLYDGMVEGYDQVEPYVAAGLLSRVMLLSDGLANTGVTDPSTILATSSNYGSEGIGLTTIGVGLDFNQDLMERLSEQSGGNFYFIQDPQKAVSVFTDELDFLVTPLATHLQARLHFGTGFAVADTYGLSLTTDTNGDELLQIPTVFASRHGGAALIRVDTTDALANHAGQPLTDLSYSYTPLAADGTSGSAQDGSQQLTCPTVTSDTDRVYQSDGVLESIVIWNMVDTFQAASNAYYGGDTAGAQQLITDLDAYVAEANGHLNDPQLQADRDQLIAPFAANLAGDPSGGYPTDGTTPCATGPCYTDSYSGNDSWGFYGCSAAGSSSWAAVLVLLSLAFRRRRRHGTDAA